LTRNDWILALHLLSAAAYIGGMVLFWVLIVAVRRADTPGATVEMEPVVRVGTIATGVGAGGTILFGIWLAFSKDSYAIWDFWIIAAIVLWAVSGGLGGRTGNEYMKGMNKAKELERAGQTGPNADLLALNRTQNGVLLHALASLALVLIVIDMIWKPGAPALADLRPNNFNLPLFIHVLGVTVLFGGVLTAAAALFFARGNARQLRLGYYSLLLVGLPGLILAKLGATLIWHKESVHSLIGSAFPHRDDPRWIEIGGTALDGGGALLVLALILGWFGVQRLNGGQGDLLSKVPVVSTMSGEKLLRLTMYISFVLLAGYVLAVWAMGGKPA
jgi:hypothetical protein